MVESRSVGPVGDGCCKFFEKHPWRLWVGKGRRDWCLETPSGVVVTKTFTKNLRSKNINPQAQIGRTRIHIHCDHFLIWFPLFHVPLVGTRCDDWGVIAPASSKQCHRSGGHGRSCPKKNQQNVFPLVILILGTEIPLIFRIQELPSRSNTSKFSSWNHEPTKAH